MLPGFLFFSAVVLLQAFAAFDRGVRPGDGFTARIASSLPGMM